MNKNDRDYLRFLGLPEEDLNKEPKEEQMKAHIFRAASSPSCTILKLKIIAKKYVDLWLEASNFISNDFYTDDDLTSVTDVESAIKLIHDAIIICKKGNLWLHKFAWNDRRVIKTILKLEKAKDLVNLSLEDLSIERALGMKWSIESDQFHFLALSAGAVEYADCNSAEG